MRQEATPPTTLLPFEAGAESSEQPLRDAVDVVHRRHRCRPYPWLSEDELAARRLLDLCQAEGLAPAAAVPEIARRFGHALQRAGLQFAPKSEKANTLNELARRPCWAANDKPPPAEKPGVLQPHHSNPGRGGSEAECAGCGTKQGGGQVGTVHLGYVCGCAAAWRASGVPYTKADDWARERRAGRSA